MSGEKTNEGMEIQLYLHFRRNFLVLAFSAIAKRVGWIFKTESIIMPGFVYNHTDSGAVRGILPLISRAGRSLPSFIAVHWLRNSRYKWHIFFLCSLVMTAVWGLLAGMILAFPKADSHLVLITFFLIYTIHWIANGIAFPFVLFSQCVPR